MTFTDRVKEIAEAAGVSQQEPINQSDMVEFEIQKNGANYAMCLTLASGAKTTLMLQDSMLSDAFKQRYPNGTYVRQIKIVDGDRRVEFIEAGR